MNNSHQNMFYRHRYRMAHFANDEQLAPILPPLNNHHEEIQLNNSPYRSSIIRDGYGRSTINGTHELISGEHSRVANNPDISISVPSSMDIQAARTLHHLFTNFDRVLESPRLHRIPRRNDWEGDTFVKLAGHSIRHTPSIREGRVKTDNTNLLHTSPPEVTNMEQLDEHGAPYYDTEDEMYEDTKDYYTDPRVEGNSVIHTIEHPVTNKSQLSQMLSRVFGSILLSHITKHGLPPDPRLDLLEDKGLVKHKREYLDSENKDIPHNKQAQFLLTKSQDGQAEKQHALVSFAVPLIRKYIDHLLEDSQRKLTFHQFLNKQRDSFTPLKEILSEMLRARPKKVVPE